MFCVFSVATEDLTVASGQNIRDTDVEPASGAWSQSILTTDEMGHASQ